MLIEINYIYGSFFEGVRSISIQVYEGSKGRQDGAKLTSLPTTCNWIFQNENHGKQTLLPFRTGGVF